MTLAGGVCRLGSCEAHRNRTYWLIDVVFVVDWIGLDGGGLLIIEIRLLNVEGKR